MVENYQMCPNDNKPDNKPNQGVSSVTRNKGSNGRAAADKARKLCTLPKRLTYAALVDRQQCETEITDFMVRRACDEMDCMQQFPFAPG